MYRKYTKFIFWLIIIERLKALFHRRWNVPVLAAFHSEGTGLRFVVLVNRLGISRDSLKASLNALLDMSLVMRNPGYGHPMRPEYILTPGTEQLAAACHGYGAATADDEIYTRKWTGPILLALAEGRSRFNEIRQNLGVTPRALTQALRQLEQHGLVERNIDDGYPPTTSYHLQDRGYEISQQVESIRDAIQVTRRLL